jgi:predicted RNA binding protein YcfA (HicA-like mRNA interferase family)
VQGTLELAAVDRYRKLVHPVTRKEVRVSMHTKKDVGRLARRILRAAGLE